MMYGMPSSGDLAFSATRELEERLKVVEDRLGITEERKKQQRAEWFKNMRKLVVMRREARAAGVTLNQYLQYQNFTNYQKMPDAVVKAYENAGEKK